MTNQLTKTKKAGELQYWLYSTGNFANNIVFLMVGTYVNYFYTDILQIPAYMAGMVFMVARLVDAVTDPIMGMIVDRTNTRFGRFRPYIIAGAPFLGIMFLSLFFAPDFSMTGKIAYAFITYIIYSLAWTIVQIPQLALPAMLTNDLSVRTRVQGIFQAFGSAASLVVTAWALPILNALGGEDDKNAWFTFIAICAVVSTVIFILSAMSVNSVDTYEAHVGDNKVKQVSLKESLSAAFKNKALICVLIAYGTDMFAYQISNSLRIFFFKYNMGGRTDLISYLGYVATFISFAMVLFVEPMMRKMGKKIGIIAIEALAIVFTLPMLIAGLTGSYNIYMVMFTYVAITLTWTINNLLSRAAVLDSANYAAIKTGINSTALVNSTFTFINKCCQAFSMFFGGVILSMTGYNPKLEVQTDGSLLAILLMCTLVPIAGYIFSLIAMYYYPISLKGEAKMQELLDNNDNQAYDVDLNI